MAFKAMLSTIELTRVASALTVDLNTQGPELVLLDQPDFVVPPGTCSVVTLSPWIPGISLGAKCTGTHDAVLPFFDGQDLEGRENVVADGWNLEPDSNGKTVDMMIDFTDAETVVISDSIQASLRPTSDLASQFSVDGTNECFPVMKINRRVINEEAHGRVDVSIRPCNSIIESAVQPMPAQVGQSTEQPLPTEAHVDLTGKWGLTSMIMYTGEPEVPASVSPINPTLELNADGTFSFYIGHRCWGTVDGLDTFDGVTAELSFSRYNPCDRRGSPPGATTPNEKAIPNQLHQIETLIYDAETDSIRLMGSDGLELQFKRVQTESGSRSHTSESLSPDMMMLNGKWNLVSIIPILGAPLVPSSTSPIQPSLSFVVDPDADNQSFALRIGNTCRGTVSGLDTFDGLVANARFSEVMMCTLMAIPDEDLTPEERNLPSYLPQTKTIVYNFMDGTILLEGDNGMEVLFKRFE